MGLKGLIKLVRVSNLLIIVLTQYFTAVFLTGRQQQWLEVLADPWLFLLVLSTTMIAAAGYMINDYYDIKIDYINKPDQVVVGRILKRRVVMAYNIGLNTVGLAIGVVLSWKIGLVHLGAIFLLWLYSNQLKRLPFVGNLSIALLTGAAVAVFAILFPNYEKLIYTYAVFAGSLTLIREIIKDMEDLRGDATFGCKTLPIVYGIRKTKVFLYLLTGIFIILLFALARYTQNNTLNYFFLVLLLPIGWFTYLLVKADSKKHFTQLSSFCKGLMVCGLLSMMLF